MRILIACGGTAGHIFPALALVEELKKERRHTQIIMIISNRPRDKDFLRVAPDILKEINIEIINPAPLPYNFSFKYLNFAIGLVRAIFKSFIIILRYTPDVAVGFGGYASFAPVIVARIIGIPTVIHEQNIIPGRANRLLSRVVKRIAITFDDTKKFLPQIKSDRIVKTGLPLRRHILDCARALSDRHKRDADKFTILVCGGSQGAHNINKLVLNCIGRMIKGGLKDLRLIHLSGKRDFHYVKVSYTSLAFDFKVFDFLEDMTGVYKIADLMICRSGANTIFEAATFGLPCILIPYARGTRHQKENALFLGRKGWAIVLDEDKTSGEDLEKTLLDLISDRKKLQNLSQKIRLLHSPDSAYNLKRLIDTLCKSN